MPTSVVGAGGSSVSSTFDLGAWGMTTDPQILRLAQYVADQLATVNTQQTNEFGVVGKAIRAGTTSCTSGQALAVATGLATVTHAVVSVKAAACGGGTAAVSATYALSATAGAIELYSWTVAGAASATSNVSWIAWGTP